MGVKVKMNYVEFIALLIVLEFAICNGKFLKLTYFLVNESFHL